jgi:hypothetical protein
MKLEREENAWFEIEFVHPLLSVYTTGNLGLHKLDTGTVSKREAQRRYLCLLAMDFISLSQIQYNRNRLRKFIHSHTKNIEHYLLSVRDEHGCHNIPYNVKMHCSRRISFEDQNAIKNSQTVLDFSNKHISYCKFPSARN